MQTVDTNNPLTMLLLRRLNDLSPEEGDELQRLISPELGMILAKILPEIAPFILTAVPYQGGAMPPAAGGGSGAPAAPGGPMPGGPMQPPPSMNRLQAVSA